MDSNPKAIKISEKFPDLPRLKVFDEVLKTYEDSNSFSPQYKVVDRNTYIGVEVEVENVHSWLQNLSPYWAMIEDGSLRNEGREFITLPIRAWRIEHALEKLFQALNKDIDFSERTSIHVHMNIRTLTVEQLEALIVTYMVFEKVLFTYIGNNRYNNIFCVPLCETDMGASLTQLITNGSPYLDWEKYTALNLSPISSKGTIEFRHHYGTKDIEDLITWINLILSLKTFALRNDVEYIWHRINSLNTTSEYRMFGEEVFGSLINTIFSPTYNEEVASCITYVKDKCLPNPFMEELRQSLKPEGSPTQRLLDEWTAVPTRSFSDFFNDPQEEPRAARVPPRRTISLTEDALVEATQSIPIPQWTFLQETPRSPEEQEFQQRVDRTLARIRENQVLTTNMAGLHNPTTSNLMNQLLRNGGI